MFDTWTQAFKITTKLIQDGFSIFVSEWVYNSWKWEFLYWEEVWAQEITTKPQGSYSKQTHFIQEAAVDVGLHGVAEPDAIAGVDVAVGHVEVHTAIHVDSHAHHY